MEVFFEFAPVKSLCGAALTDITPTTVNSILGEPDDIEKGESGNFGEASFSYHFNAAQLTLFFDVEHLLCVATTNPAFKLFGEEVFKLHEDKLISLFKHNHFPDHIIDKDWGEKQLIFEKAGLTVFFDNQKVSEIFIDV
ncbi:MAG: hypothetical protein SGJ15_05795 [Bacteroidota bacterium]|nr:hypothetical protein [Bacteroidota bacterium]